MRMASLARCRRPTAAATEPSLGEHSLYRGAGGGNWFAEGDEIPDQSAEIRAIMDLPSILPRWLQRHAPRSAFERITAKADHGKQGAGELGSESAVRHLTPT